jgi:dTMP kinase
VKEKFSGRFVVLDGPDGCGKTTQTRLLVQWLRGQGVEVESFREPGGTAIGEKIRQVLLDPEHIALSTPAEVMLYMAARVQLWAERIAPALKEKKCVVLDRWLCSTCAYQGIDPKVAASRLKRDLDRMERKGDGYHQKVRQGFLELAARRKYFVVDASDDVEAVHKEVVEVIARADF